jgi:aspartate 1-decarboxylase
LRPQSENMLIQICKSKIHRVRVTQADLNYIGSITIDEALMEAANLVEGERVQVVNCNNGERLETYVIKGLRNSGTICLNGPAARRCQVNDIVIIIGYGFLDFEEAKTFKPALVFPNEQTNLID